jgi:hypothetical protein
MSSSGSNVHSLTASKAKKKGKEKRCLCDRPSNLNRPANDNCRDTLLTTDMGTRGKKRSRLHSTSCNRRPSSMFFDREIRSEWYTHTHQSRWNRVHTPNKPKKIVAFYQSFLICLLLRGSSQCGPSVPLLSMTTAGDGPGLLLPSSFTTRLPESSVTATCVGAVLNGNGRATVESLADGEFRLCLSN